MSEIAERGYAVPDVLVSTNWVQQHLNDPDVRIVESNEDPLLYASGHIPGAVEIDWTRDLNDPLRRDYLDKEHFEALMARSGISNDTTVVFYGDKNNWWATYAAWVFHLFGHLNIRIMDGGRKKWTDEGRPTDTKRATPEPAPYTAPVRDDKEFRAFRDEVMRHVAEHGKLVDVRSPQEFSGERTHMPDYPNEGALRGGHIPGAASVPWAKAVAEDGTFRDVDALKAIYEEGAGVAPADDVIVYCRIGERSSHTWFVLRYLLGYPNVKNYDGSWTEWGNLVGAPIEKVMPPKLQAILDDLAMFPDRADRIDALIALSREYVHPSSSEVPRIEEARVPGCESEVFMARQDGSFRFAVDNPQGVSAMALARILEEGLDGKPADVPDDLVYTVFGRELSMGKNLGLTNMVRMVRQASLSRSAE